MKINLVSSLWNLLTTAAICLFLTSCSSATSQPVHSSGTPVNPFTNPGAADQPTAPLTGAQPRKY